MIDIANQVGTITAKGAARLACALESIEGVKADHALYDDLIAKRDSLLAYAA